MLGALWPGGKEKCGEPASEDTWRIEVKWETAEPAAVPTGAIATKDGAGGDDTLSYTSAHSYREKRPFSLAAKLERRWCLLRM